MTVSFIYFILPILYFLNISAVYQKAGYEII